MERRPNDTAGKSPGQGERIAIDDAIRVGLALLRDGHLEEADQVLSDIIEAAPDNPDALHFYGVLQHQLGKSREGARYIRRAIEHAPKSPGIHSNLGNVLKELGDFSEAEAAYRKAIELAPSHPDAHCNLGVVLRIQRRLDEAKASLQTAIEQNPDHGEAHHNLGNVHRDLGEWDDAITNYRKAVRLYGYSGIKGNAARNLANALYRTGDVEEGRNVLREWLSREPDNVVAQHMYAGFTDEQVPDKASDEYVRKVFDDFAGSFDHVLYKLDYKAPMLVADAIGRVFPEKNADQAVLDLGCGTGLSGALVAPFASRLIGVDLSPEMLRRARERKVYDELHEAELVEFIRGRDQSFSMVTCVDTFVYFGVLDDAFDAVAAVLKPGGWFFFTVELHEDDTEQRPYRMSYHGRYSHARQYVESALTSAGFKIEGGEEGVLRSEGVDSVYGLVVSARRVEG